MNQQEWIEQFKKDTAENRVFVYAATRTPPCVAYRIA
jgi:hypothetical protein